MGLSESFIDESCPKDLEPYNKAHELRMYEKDYDCWLQGLYIMASVSVSLDHSFNGRKASSEYPKEPILKKTVEANRPLTEEEKEIQLKQFLKSLEDMQEKFEKNKQGGNG